jgi:hypothetical protein
MYFMDKTALRKYIFPTLAFCESDNMSKRTLFAAGLEEDIMEV